MTLSNARATLGLTATATLGAYGTSGNVQLGLPTQNIRLDAVTSGYSMLAVFSGHGTPDALIFNLLENVVGGGTTSWVAGAAQVETATAAGTITTAGNATAIVTSAGMAGSPLTVTFAVALNDTPDQWAAKARAGLAANATIAARFEVIGTTTQIALRRKPVATFVTPEGVLPIYVSTGNDGTFNIALADGTSAGITEAATSTNTTAGVPTDGVKIYDGDSKDMEGSTIAMTAIHGFQATLISAAAMTMIGNASDEEVILAPGENFTRAAAQGLSIDTEQVFTAAAPASLSITVLGS